MVNGGWNDWSEWARCDSTLGPGCTNTSAAIYKYRYCDNPAPSGGGAICSGDETIEQDYGKSNSFIQQHVKHIYVQSYKNTSRYVCCSCVQSLRFHRQSLFTCYVGCEPSTRKTRSYHIDSGKLCAIVFDTSAKGCWKQMAHCRWQIKPAVPHLFDAEAASEQLKNDIWAVTVE